MPAILSVLNEPNDVKARLASMGLTEEPLLHAARRWYLSWISFTANHPAFGIGIAAWMEAVAGLREGLLPVGWIRSDENNYALVMHPDGTMAINVATGDAGTGVPTANVSNKAPKGVSTADAISVNQVQIELDLPVPDIPHVRGEEGPLTWFLLLHRAGAEVRCELSLPSELSADGRITRWQERIILPSIPIDGAEIEIVAPESPDLDIDVKRKA
ncbi:MAG TPA: hypothetical protein VN831_06290 [Bradyrhizobium sp.]|nr:hypothetical protein [Bradyrhizobium sp.]